MSIINYRESDIDRLQRRVDRTNKLIKLLSIYRRVEHHTNPNLFLVNGKYYVATLSDRWRVKGKGKWYWGYPPNDNSLHSNLEWRGQYE